MSKKFVYLHVPTFEELSYRQQLLSEPETMSYNRGHQHERIDPETGCVSFPPEDWQAFYQHFIGQEPLRFYAYIVRSDNDEFIGEVNVREVPGKPWYEMGIIVSASERGRGYSNDALEELLEVAFARLGAPAVHNFFEDHRKAAIALHLAHGFQITSHEGEIMEFLITREDYEKERGIRL